jgi:hypothetical protein
VLSGIEPAPRREVTPPARRAVTSRPSAPRPHVRARRMSPHRPSASGLSPLAHASRGGAFEAVRSSRRPRDPHPRVCRAPAHRNRPPPAPRCAGRTPVPLDRFNASWTPPVQDRCRFLKRAGHPAVPEPSTTPPLNRRRRAPSSACDPSLLTTLGSPLDPMEARAAAHCPALPRPR